ncbi:hypothetical protein E4U39_005530 [Claviceps sp. Clav50 group G5]|nr:hypothetical protein E4U39_005530 [Claviceps sp. Clav50 group G5]
MERAMRSSVVQAYDYSAEAAAGEYKTSRGNLQLARAQGDPTTSRWQLTPSRDERGRKGGLRWAFILGVADDEDEDED